MPPAKSKAPRAITLPRGAVTFIDNGGRDIACDRLEVTPPLVAGAPVQLLDEAGDEVGLAIFDVDNQKLRMFATPSDGFSTIDGALLAVRVERALKLRRAIGLAGDGKDCSDTYRLLHGAGDGVPGFSCDVLGKWGVLHVYAECMLPLGRQLAEAIAGFARLDGVVLKTRRRGGAAEVPHEFVGKTPSALEIAHEHGVPMELHLAAGLNVGLFTDMREHRRSLARFAAGKRVLNLFSYTGALSLACARAGAASVVSVDTSAGVHAWAQANFARSNLSTADKQWRWETGDAVRFLARAVKDREQYDLVLIDPPTFSTARGVPWTLDRDYPELIAAAAEVIPDGGLLWLAANTHDLKSLPALADKGLRSLGRSTALLEQGGLPADYPTLPAQPKDRYLQVCLLRV